MEYYNNHPKKIPSESCFLNSILMDLPAFVNVLEIFFCAIMDVERVTRKLRSFVVVGDRKGKPCLGICLQRNSETDHHQISKNDRG